MRGKKTILATAAAGCLAATLYATQSRASEWCNVWSWWDSPVDHTCYFNGGNVRAKAQGIGTTNKMVFVDLVEASPAPNGVRYATVDGTDSGGNVISSCYAFDFDPASGASGYDTTGCQNATGISVTLAYYDGSVRDDEGKGDDRNALPKPLREVMQKDGSQFVK